MPAKPKVYIVQPLFGVDHLFDHHFWPITTDMKKADIVVFTGGADIHPSIYDEPEHPSENYNRFRDRHELEEFDRAFNLQKRMSGICRGHQLLAALAGYSLYRDINGHTRSHWVEDHYYNREYMVTSVHHQAVRPVSSNTNDLKPGSTWLSTRLSTQRIYIDSLGVEQVETELTLEIEGLIIPNLRAVTVQGHPEYVPESEFAKLYLHTLQRIF